MQMQMQMLRCGVVGAWKDVRDGCRLVVSDIREEEG